MANSNSTWILVADRARARIFEAAPDHKLTEVECFANPDGRAMGRDIETDRPPRVNESMGSTRHAIEPHTTLRDKSITRFARLLCNALERGHEQRCYQRLVLAAPPRFLGALRANLAESLQALITDEIRHDLTALPTHELREHLPPSILAQILPERLAVTKQ